MESDKYGEHRGREVLYRGEIKSPKLMSHSDSPFFNYGQGFFETILYEKGRLQFLKEHLERMKRTCSEFNISLDYSEIEEKPILELLEKNNLTNKSCRVKILYAPIEKGDRWDTVVTAAPYTRPVNDFILSIHNEIYDSFLNRYKSLNYQYNLHWRDYYHRKENSDEVLFCNKEGNILEGSYTNVLYVKDSTLYYVDKCNNYLQGIMQDQVLFEAEKIQGLSIEALTEGIEISQIREADEVIICNSLMTVQNVRKIIYGDEVYSWGSSSSSDSLASMLKGKLLS